MNETLLSHPLASRERRELLSRFASAQQLKTIPGLQLNQGKRASGQEQYFTLCFEESNYACKSQPASAMVLMLFASPQKKGLAEQAQNTVPRWQSASVGGIPPFTRLFFPWMIFFWQANQSVLSPYQHPLKTESRTNLIYQKSAETITCLASSSLGLHTIRFS